MIRLALLPSSVPSAWWSALLEGLVERNDVDLLWVAEHAPVDPRVAWLPLDASSASPPNDAAARAAADARPNAVAAAPPVGVGVGADASASPTRAALIADVSSPRASVVAPLAHELTLVAVVDRPDVLRSVDGDGLALAEAARRVVCTDALLPATVPAHLQASVVVVPRGIDAGDAPVQERPVDRSPTVVVLGGPMSDPVRAAWTTFSQQWPQAVLVADLEALDAPARARVLHSAHVVVVLDSTGTYLAEALASGATVIAHADAYASSIISHAVDGLLADGRSPEQLAATLHYAATYHEQLASVRAAGRALAQRRLTAASLANRVIELLEQSPPVVALSGVNGSRNGSAPIAGAERAVS